MWTILVATAAAVTPVWTGTTPRPSSFLGTSVVLVDVDGDGADEVFAGAPWWIPSPATGRAGGVLGWASGAAGPIGAPTVVVAGDQAGGGTGDVLAGGDLDGDGYGDLVLGEPAWNHRGRVRVAYGTAAGLGAPVVVATGDPRSDLGTGLLVADLDLDGDDELVVGAPSADVGGVSAAGAVLVFDGGPGGVGPAPSWSWTGSAADDGVGFSLAAGDPNGDGWPDLVVGSWSFGGTRGRALGFAGTGAGLPAAPSWSSEGAPGDWYGYSVALGDLDGDGYDELAVGAISSDTGAFNSGEVTVLQGGPGGPGAVVARLAGTRASGVLGYRVAVADLDGDGLPDLVATAPGQGSSGATLGWRGAATLTLAAPDAVLQPIFAFPGASSGEALAVGDTDGDGRAELAVGAPDASYAVQDAAQGAVLLYRAP